MKEMNLTHKLMMMVMVIFVTTFILAVNSFRNSDVHWLTGEYLRTQIELNRLQIDKLKE